MNCVRYHLERVGRATIAEIAKATGRAHGTVETQIRRSVADGMVSRVGTVPGSRKHSRGEAVYALVQGAVSPRRRRPAARPFEPGHYEAPVRRRVPDEEPTIPADLVRSAIGSRSQLEQLWGMTT